MASTVTIDYYLRVLKLVGSRKETESFIRCSCCLASIIALGMKQPINWTPYRYWMSGLNTGRPHDFKTTHADFKGYCFCYLWCVFQPRKSYDLNIIPAFFPTHQPAPILARYVQFLEIRNLNHSENF